jgi:methylglutaconyl-CoA hydratase
VPYNLHRGPPLNFIAQYGRLKIALAPPKGENSQQQAKAPHKIWPLASTHPPRAASLPGAALKNPPLPMHPQGHISTAIQSGIANVEFFHPAGNSLPGALLQHLAEAIAQASHDARARVIVLRSGGSGPFCAGANFQELGAIATEAEGLQFFSGFATVINAMRQSQKLIIARIQGKCVGGGVGLAAAADYALATERASVKLSELAVGIGPFVVGPAVERKLGLSAFSQLAIDAGSFQTADWAHRHGLFAQLHPHTEALDAAVHTLADRLSQSSPEAMAELKRVFWAGTNHWDALLPERAAISGRLILGAAAQQALLELSKK